MKGRFITVEGGEGAGKTTCMNWVRAWLESRGAPVRVTREPGGTRLGEAIRTLLLDTGEEPPVPMAELLLVFAARAQHLERVIRPTLAQGVWVLCDRFTDATYAYQGAGRGLGEGPVALLERLVQQGLEPDLTLVLDLDPAAGLRRARNRSAPDRFEREAADFYRRVRVAYLERARRRPERYAVIDAAAPPEAVRAAVERALAEHFSGELG